MGERPRASAQAQERAGGAPQAAAAWLGCRPGRSAAERKQTSQRARLLVQPLAAAGPDGLGAGEPYENDNVTELRAGELHESNALLVHEFRTYP